jgi:protein SCO1/2
MDTMKSSTIAFSKGVTLFLAAIASGGCGGEPPPVAPPASAESRVELKAADSIEAKSYPLTGVVRKVDRKTGLVSIKHEEVVGFMPAMTMPFDLKGQPILDELQVGDEVTATLHVTSDDTSLSDVEITRPAMPGEHVSGKPAATVLKPGEFVPDFTMTTQDGKTIKLSDLRGKTVVLTFIYTRCPLPTFCPLMDRKFGQLANLLEKSPKRAERVQLLSLSFDPKHDLPATLARHAELVGAREPLWTFAVADYPELSKVGPPLGLMYDVQEAEIMHSLSTAVIDPKGRLAWLDRSNTWTPEEVFKVVGFLTRPSKN